MIKVIMVIDGWIEGFLLELMEVRDEFDWNFENF